MPIRKLDAYTIEQIAAGEVIESPFSVVKELVENSIDAGAKNITVEIKNGGKTYIRVTDDGIGISKDDFRLAFEKHTTSKIINFDDLYNIYSLGFRGEALSTIVSVANVSAISKSKDEDIGTRLVFTSKGVSESPIATNQGCSIEVTDLFANLPVRKKFLKSDIAEANSISKLMYSLALGYEGISFKYIKDNRMEFKTNLGEVLEVRIANLLDENIKDELISIESKNDIYSVKGFISTPNYYRGSRSLQYLFVNNRLVESKLITSTIENEYRSYIPNARFPAVFLFINTNPKNIDVNVHPNKKMIKFIYEEELVDLLKTAVFKALNENSNPNRIYKKESKDESILDFSNYGAIIDKYRESSYVKEDKSSYENNDKSFFENNDLLLDKVKDEIIDDQNNPSDNDFNNSYENISFTKENTFTYLTSIFEKFSIFESSDKTIIIMDHRRADEAIKFKRLSEEINQGNVSSQMLINPFVINLRASDKIKFEEKKQDILKLGFDIDLISSNQIIIRSIPQIFEEPENDKFFFDLLDLDFASKEDIFIKNIKNYLKSISFKKGHKIGKDEAIKLLDQVKYLENPYKTYEGKSIILKLTSKELEKYFDR